MSTGNLYSGLTWSRSTTTLTITSTAHGLLVGDYVVIRNMSEDYSYLEIQTVADVNTFTLTVANSGGSAGTDGAYIPAASVSGVGEAAATVATPTAGNIQINSIVATTGGTTVGTNFALTMPNSISNGSGDNNSVTDQNPPIVGVFNLATGGYVAGASSVTINTSANFNEYTVGNLQSFGPNNMMRFQF